MSLDFRKPKVLCHFRNVLSKQTQKGGERAVKMEGKHGRKTDQKWKEIFAGNNTLRTFIFQA